MRILEPASCLRFNYLAQEGLISENLQAKDDNNEPISQEEFRASKVCAASYPGDVTVGPLSCLRHCHVHPVPGGLTPVKGTRALADGEVESVLPRDTERMLLPAFGTGSMSESYFKILSSKPLCLCWEPRMSLCTSSPAIPGGSSVLSQPFTNKECDRPVWWLPGLRFLLLIMLDISVFICWFIVLLFIASVILFSYCQVA